MKHQRCLTMIININIQHSNAIHGLSITIAITTTLALQEVAYCFADLTLHSSGADGGGDGRHLEVRLVVGQRGRVPGSGTSVHLGAHPQGELRLARRPPIQPAEDGRAHQRRGRHGRVRQDRRQRQRHQGRGRLVAAHQGNEVLLRMNI